MFQFQNKPLSPVRRVLFCFCILHAARDAFPRVLWKPLTNDYEVVLPWSVPGRLKNQAGPPLDNDMQSRLATLWAQGLEGRVSGGFKRSEGHPCYMPAVTSTNIPPSVTATVESLKRKIEAQTDSRLPGRRLPSNCYNYDLDAAGVMIASRIRQYHSLLKWFKLIRERYGYNTGSIVWATNSTFDSITHCLQEMQHECMCDRSSITPNSYILTNCMIPPPTSEQSDQAALMLNSLDEFSFIIESVSYYVSQMKQSSPEGIPLCSNSS